MSRSEVVVCTVSECRRGRCSPDEVACGTAASMTGVSGNAEVTGMVFSACVYLLGICAKHLWIKVSRTSDWQRILASILNISSTSVTGALAGRRSGDGRRSSLATSALDGVESLSPFSFFCSASQ